MSRPAFFGQARPHRLPLLRHEVFHTADAELAREELARLRCPHRLEVLDPETALDARLHRAELGRVSIGYLRYGTDVRLEFEQLDSFYAVLIPLEGVVKVARGTRSTTLHPGQARVLSPSEPFSLVCSGDCAQLIVSVERGAMEAELLDLLGPRRPDPVRFDPVMDLTSGLGRSWWSLIRHVVGDLDLAECLALHQTSTAHVQRAIIVGLLGAHAHNYTEQLRARSRVPAPEVIRRAVELIEHRPDLAVTTAELARRVGVGTRALQAGFRRHLDTTPMEYLRHTRINRARADLQYPRTGTTVSLVASRWGFTHLGRFAAEYRCRYDEYPSDTLRRAVTSDWQARR